MVPIPFRSSRRESRRRAREVLDAEKAKLIRSEATDDAVELDDETTEALREVSAEETAETVESSSRSRSRDRNSSTSEDGARANERRQTRRERGQHR